MAPYGFGFIFHEIVATQMEAAGLAIDMKDIPYAMLIPTAGLVVGLLIAVFISYRKPREYTRDITIEETTITNVNKKIIFFTVLSLIVALVAQIQTESMIMGALAGILTLYVTGALKWKEADLLLTDGMRVHRFCNDYSKWFCCRDSSDRRY